jgi:DNA helicase-2/ATP-dependent DNA helicase PcrA
MEKHDYTAHTFIADDSQIPVIRAKGGHHLVLSPPGCGKTGCLTERIRWAHDNEGVAYDDMLCLTFTNRAARGMFQRIDEAFEDADVKSVFVGNIHRFCSQLLYNHNIVPIQTSVIDEDVQMSIICSFSGADEEKVKSEFRLSNACFEVVKCSHYMWQVRHNVPRAVRVDAKGISSDDVTAFRSLLQQEDKPFTPANMLNFYEQIENTADDYLQLITEKGFPQTYTHAVRKLLRAHQYERYKQENQLMDFTDILLYAYEALRNDAEGIYRKYHWIQVDEVQDLTALQLAIIDLATADQDYTVVYLGDEQQAIFSFMGAKISTLGELKRRCQGHLLHLNYNHRSPKYLLDVFNTYASQQLRIDADFLPLSTNQDRAQADSLAIISSRSVYDEAADMVSLINYLSAAYPEDRTAVVVLSNADADMVSEHLDAALIRHFKVSGVDVFSLPQVRLLFAHLSVLHNEGYFLSWAQLFAGFKLFDNSTSAREFVRELFLHYIYPSDALLYEGGRTYIADFYETCSSEEVVVFDTETTGLDVYEDDIIQIAAVKLRNGEQAGESFNIFIETTKELPEVVGGQPNPIKEAYDRAHKYTHAEALTLFMEYIGSDALLGHNVNFDYNILNANLRRYLGIESQKAEHTHVFDTLKIARILEPQLQKYKLEYLLERLNLEGENSHNAFDDVNATCSLVAHCLRKAADVLPVQQQFLSKPQTMDKLARLRNVYGYVYNHAMHHLHDRGSQSGEPALISELNEFYKMLLESGYITEIPKLQYIIRYIQVDMLQGEENLSLEEQLSRHVIDLTTLKEADLCGNEVQSLTENVFVSTIHKAKGLEFENVIVFDVVDGRMPNHYNKTPAENEEDSRKLYVALSRARKRLYIMHSSQNDWGYARYLSPFVNCIKPSFQYQTITEFLKPRADAMEQEPMQ